MAPLSPLDRSASPGSQLLTSDEVADILRVSARTVRRLGERGAIRRVRVGERTVRYFADDIESLLNDDEAPGTAPRRNDSRPAAAAHARR